MSKMSMDFDIAHRLRWPGRPMSLGSCALLMVSSPGLQLLMLHRINHLLYLKRKDSARWGWVWRVMFMPFAPLKWAIKANSKIEISECIKIDYGIFFSDQGYIIFGASKIGTGTIIGTRVTIGMGHADNGRPEIGSNVWIGSDCVIYGAISIGDGSTLLPGTVLSKSIPAGVVMQGNPARLVSRNFDNSKLRMFHDTDAIQPATDKWEGISV